MKLNERAILSDLLSEEDVSGIMSKAESPMVKAYISLSDEVGPRVGETGRKK
jgi:hypothetical protein